MHTTCTTTISVLYHYLIVSSIRVTTPAATYNVHIAPGLLHKLYPRLRKLTPGKTPRLFVVTSPQIWALWHKAFLASFPATQQPTVLFLPAGESHKRLASVESLAQQLSLAGADRDSILLAFGGGVIGDVTGFLAAIYMRGIRYVGLPTTLLAQVDSSLGGKTGVNLLAGKNLIGAFHHPLAVYADIDLLGTLPAAELRSGLQEAIKAGIIYDAKLFRYMELNATDILSGKSSILARVVTASVRVKAEVVSQDEEESGLRMILNFGHTIGHAIEAVTHYRKLLHGEAVAWGMIAALHVSLARQLVKPDEFARMANLILRYGPIPPFKADPAKLVALTSSDKKTRSGRRAFVLAAGIGRIEVHYDVTDAELLVATAAMLKTMQQVEG
ncbi:MAG TPA: 3-dehydroquinate synthase [Acidobacteriaceae bacterium]|jgi:3-dehydroquinate synthase|nr:3-dehydroquinate synthase [Acidobacteriaceae bacterium]